MVVNISFLEERALVLSIYKRIVIMNSLLLQPCLKSATESSFSKYFSPEKRSVCVRNFMTMVISFPLHLVIITIRLYFCHQPSLMRSSSL